MINGVLLSQLLAVIKANNDTELRALLEVNPGSEAAIVWRDNCDRTLLDYAVIADAAICIRVMISYYFDPFDADSTGCTPLMRASGLGRSECVREFLMGCYNVPVRDKHGRTASMLAAISGHSLTLDLLLQNRNDVLETDRFSKTSDFYASAYGHGKCVPVIKYFLGEIELLRKQNGFMNSLAFDLDFKAHFNHYFNRPPQETSRMMSA